MRAVGAVACAAGICAMTLVAPARGQLPPGHPTLAAPAEGAPTGALPPGHPSLPPGAPGESDTGGMERLPNFRQARMPESIVADAPQLPPGVLLVRVVDVNGNPVPGVQVHLGALRDGERTPAGEVTTRADGVAQFERLDGGTAVAYRASIDVDGARSLSSPFQMPAHNGFNVQLVKIDADHEPHSILISDARVEIAIQDDRLIVVERVRIVNFSSMSLTAQAPHPVTFAPPGGLRFALPAGYLGFRSDEQTMGDQHVVEEGGAAVVHGSFPPTAPQDAITIVFQYRLKLDGTAATFDVTLPLPTLRVTVISEAPEGMHLEVAGMQPAEERQHEGQRILLTGRERSSRDDAPIDLIRVRISGLPAGPGLARKLATGAAITVVLGAIVFGVQERRKSGRGEQDRRRRKGALERERERLLSDAAHLAQSHTSGEVGPETYARRRRALALALAAVLKELAEIDVRPAARSAS